MFFLHSLCHSHSIAPLQILSKSGIKNTHDTCYLNSLLQILCGSVIYRFFEDLPYSSKMLNLLQAVHKDIGMSNHGPLDYTRAMKTIKTFVTSGGEDSNVQFDSFECMTRILSSIIDDTSYNDSFLGGMFDTRTLHIRKFLCCGTIKGNIENAFCLYLPVGNSNYHNATIQSLIWDWCTISQRNHVGGECHCEIPDSNFLHRSYIMSAPAVMTIVLDRNVFNTVTCSGVIDPVSITVSPKLDIKNVVLGETASSTESYTLIGLVY